MAMTAAETGHLVLGTLHTTGAVKTIDRIIDALPIEEREQTKSFLSQSLLAVVTQVLVKTADGQGRKAICEVMVMTKAIAKLIQTDQTHQIPSQLQMGREFGMQMLDQALLAAVQAKEIDPDDAYRLRARTSACCRNSSPTPRCCRSSTRRRRSGKPERMASDRRLPEGSPAARGLGPAFHGRRSAAHPPVWRPVAAARRDPDGRFRARGAVRDHAAPRRSSASRSMTAPTSPTRWASWAAFAST